MKNRIHIHIKTDLIFLGLLVLLIHIYFLLIYVPMKMIFECTGFFNCYIEYLEYFWVRDILNTFSDLWNLAIWIAFVMGYLFLFNLGFRVFEWDGESFCMKSWFGKRCYKWKDLEAVYVSTQFGSDSIILVTWDNMYYGPYHSELFGILKEKRKEYGFTMRDVEKGENLSYLRKRRKEHGTRMMLFQP